MNRWTIPTAVLSVALLAACAGPATTSADQAATTSGSEVAEPAVVTAAEAVETDWDPADEVAITLEGSSASVDGEGASADGATVTITAPGTYRVSGALEDGQLLVDSAGDGLVRIVLDDAEITSSASAPLVVSDADEVVVHLADGTSSVLTDAEAYVYPDAATDEPNATLFSTADLTIAGGGTLTVHGNADDGIASKDGLTLLGGTIVVDAADDGVRGKDYLVVDGASVDVTAGGDGLKADNAEDASLGYVSLVSGAVSVGAGGDGVDAATQVLLEGGDLTVTAGGGVTGAVATDVSAKGVKGAVAVVLSGTTLVVDALDDALHSDGSVTVSGGDATLSSGDDGVHADSDLTVSGGTLTVGQAYEGLEAATMTVSGGTTELTTFDDGVNVAGGNDGSGTASAGGGPDGVGGGDAFVGDFHLAVTGGTLVINAGGDGLDSNGTAEMSGGTVVVNGPTENMNGAIDVNGTFDVTGGVLAAAGSSGMAEAPETTSGQAWVGFGLGGTEPAGTVLTLTADDGTVVAVFESSKDFSSFVFSSPELVPGKTYEVAVGGSLSGTTIGGLALEGGAAGTESLGSTTAQAG